MKIVAMTCPHCNASLRVDASENSAVCEYCGAVSAAALGHAALIEPLVRGDGLGDDLNCAGSTGRDLPAVQQIRLQIIHRSLLLSQNGFLLHYKISAVFPSIRFGAQGPNRWQRAHSDTLPWDEKTVRRQGLRTAGLFKACRAEVLRDLRGRPTWRL